MCVLLTLFVCLLSGLTSLRGMFTRFLSSASPPVFVSLWFSPSMCLSLYFSPPSLSICPSVYVSFSFGPPTQNSRFNSEGVFFWLITLGIFPPRVWTLFLGGVLFLDLGAGESHANYPGYWLLQHRSCDLHEVTFSSNAQTFATFFWKTINSAAFSSASLSCTFFFLSCYTTPSLFLWLLSSHKQRRFTAKRMKGVWGTTGKIVGVFSRSKGFTCLLICSYSKQSRVWRRVWVTRMRC